MPTYPPPNENPKCICPNPMAAFFCAYGHMLECHYPLTCDQAQCSHFEREMAGGGGFGNALSRLRTLELMTGTSDDLRASEELFD